MDWFLGAFGKSEAYYAYAEHFAFIWIYDVTLRSARGISCSKSWA